MRFWATEYVKQANADIGAPPSYPANIGVGAGLGALPGAALGYLAGKGKGALIGAGIGGAMGAGFGALKAWDENDAMKGELRFSQLPPEHQQRLANLFHMANAGVPLSPQAEADLEPHYWHMARMHEAKQKGAWG